MHIKFPVVSDCRQRSTTNGILYSGMTWIGGGVSDITGSHGSGITVVRSMSIVNGKAVTLDRCISKTTEENLTKIGRS